MSTLIQTLLEGIESGTIQMTWVVLMCIVIPASLAAILGVCVDAFRFAVSVILSIPFFIHLALFGKRMDKTTAVREYAALLRVFLGQREKQPQLSSPEPVEEGDDSNVHGSKRSVFIVLSHLFMRKKNE